MPEDATPEQADTFICAGCGGLIAPDDIEPDFTPDEDFRACSWSCQQEVYEIRALAAESESP